MDDLWRAIEQWIVAKKEYDKAREEYDGYSWDWAGHDVITALEDARILAEKAINETIDKRIRAALKLE